MGDVDRTDLAGGRIQWSLSRLAAEFGMARETVSKRLAAGDVLPCGQRNGHDVFRLAEAAPAILGHARDEPVDDPKALPPVERRAWFQSENERLKSEREKRRLIPVDEVAAELSFFARTTVQVLETLPDLLERDCGIDGAAVERARHLINQQREVLHQRLTESDPPQPATP